jgi:hypothetical protein
MEFTQEQAKAIERLYCAVPAALHRDAEFQEALSALAGAGVMLCCSNLQLHFVPIAAAAPAAAPALSAAEEAHGDAAFLRTLRIDPDLEAKG